jgi:hypothetical protein
MERIKVTGDAVISTLREVAAERPDYVYEAPEAQREGLLYCFYVHNDGEAGVEVPGCIVGHVLHRLGVPLDSLAQHEGKGAHVVAEEFLEIQGDLTRDAEFALCEAQGNQDTGRPWGESVAIALDRTA